MLGRKGIVCFWQQFVPSLEMCQAMLTHNTQEGFSIYCRAKTLGRKRWPEAAELRERSFTYASTTPAFFNRTSNFTALENCLWSSGWPARGRPSTTRSGFTLHYCIMPRSFIAEKVGAQHSDFPALSVAGQGFHSYSATGSAAAGGPSAGSEASAVPAAAAAVVA